MLRDPSASEASRRQLLARTSALVVSARFLSASPSLVQARDYASRLEALDDLDRLASACAMRLEAVARSRADADILVRRFGGALTRHRASRDDVRRRFALPAGSVAASGPGDADLPALRQSLDALMNAYAESLPVFADSAVVSRFAVDMVEVSKLRTVIDLWVEAESA